MMAVAKGLIGAVRMPGMAWSFSRKGYQHHARRFDSNEMAGALVGKQLAVTGTNGGIGFAIAKAWTERHADVWMLCRNRERGQAARQQLMGLGEGKVNLEIVDVANMASIDACVKSLELPQLDALVHNAGALVHERRETASGIDQTFACHVIGPQRLNRRLLPVLEKAPDPRVIYIASGGMYAEKLCIEDLLDPPSPFDGVRTYALAKRAQVVLVEQWAATSDCVKFFAMHPGWVDTPGVEQALPRFYRTTKPWLRTTEQGADTAVWLSSAQKLDLKSGALVFDRQTAARHVLPGTRANKDQLAKLWDVVEKLASMDETFSPTASPTAEGQQTFPELEG